MPYDSVSLAVIVASAALIVCAFRLTLPVSTRLGLLLFAAFLIRLDPAWQHSLHRWDESYHALVAKNLTTDPLTPTLYRRPLLPYDYRDWLANHIWLHKPPGALWLMAASMRVFGIDEVAMRIPSVLLSTAAVWLTFLIGRLAFDTRVGLLAAAFHGVNGLLVALSSGRRVADHVDTALIFFVELGILMVLLYERRARVATLILAGASTGAALLTKSLPGLLVVPVAFAIFLGPRRSLASIRKCVVIGGVALALAAPWTIYTWHAFPREARWSGLYTVMHASQTLEGQRSDWLTYVRDMPRFFGYLVWIPVLAALYTATRDAAQRGLRSILIWAVIPYATFSPMPTRLPGYVMVGAPAIFLVQSWFWYRLRDRLPTFSDRRLRAATLVLLALLALLPARYLLEPRGVFERRDRHPAGVRELEQLSSRLRLSDAVIFNVPTPIEAMFYSPYTVYERMPTTEEVRDLRANGLPVVIYEPAGTKVIVPHEWDVIVLRHAMTH